MTSTGHHAPPLEFDVLVVTAASWVLAATAAWAGVLLAAAVVEAASGGRLPALARVGCPVAWRPVLLSALGGALAVLGVAPAHAESPAGPAPGPASGPASGEPLLEVPARPLDLPTVVVAPGDSLWGLARGQLAPGARALEVRAYVDRLHRVNRAVVGTDPDLILPGQRLVLPAVVPHPTREDTAP